MTYRNIARLVVVVLATAALVACSDRSPAAPTTPGAVSSNATPEGSGGLTAQAVEGTYTLNLADTTGQIVSSLPVVGSGLPSELLLWAQVSSPGGLAQRGNVIFQVCRREGSTSPSYRPKADCDSGVATWHHVSTADITEGCSGLAPDSGNVCRIFGYMPIPITIGFRYKFIGKGVIANGVSASQDMTWVAVQ